MRKQQARTLGTQSIYFYRDRNKEIDFILPKGGRYEVYEVKWAEHLDKQAVKQMDAFYAVVGPNNVINRTVICRTPNAYPIDQRTMAVSLNELQCHSKP